MLTPGMVAALAPHIRGQIVWDLGAGDGQLSLALKQMGADTVYSVEPHPPHPAQDDLPPGVVLVKEYIRDLPLPEEAPVVFISWPLNRAVRGLVEWVRHARMVVYLGSNFDGVACGDRDLFLTMLRRDVVMYVPDRHNNLIVLGQRRDTSRAPLPEEEAAFSGKILHSPV